MKLRSLALAPVLAPLFALVMAFPALAEKISLNEISRYLNGLKTAQAEFTQVNGDGSISTGTVFIHRPNRVRFEYKGDKTLVLASAGQVAVFDGKSRSGPQQYPLSKTPLKLLLEDRIDLSKASIDDVKADEDIVTVKMSDASVFGNARISMVFDAASSELRQWTITDAQGKDTTVMIFNVKEGVPLKDSAFAIDYNKVAETNSRRGSGGRGR